MVAFKWFVLGNLCDIYIVATLGAKFCEIGIGIFWSSYLFQWNFNLVKYTNLCYLFLNINVFNINKSIIVFLNGSLIVIKRTIENEYELFPN